ncbi:hypothetical protein TPAR_04070 [Tolypocladium paradoxum]|uniref:Uncharacterized protein n=1 Tax=Tolypocladium paradoxum TaxID=94208 RepID=A0A2S4KZW6_9HYPO|nr:hypothetical protein TPAR_04070 [Tolypocladium paradoxum]
MRHRAAPQGGVIHKAERQRISTFIRLPPPRRTTPHSQSKIRRPPSTPVPSSWRSWFSALVSYVPAYDRM